MNEMLALFGQALAVLAIAGVVVWRLSISARLQHGIDHAKAKEGDNLDMTEIVTGSDKAVVEVMVRISDLEEMLARRMNDDVEVTLNSDGRVRIRKVDTTQTSR